MTLLEVRKDFVKLSGRYDLVTDTTSYGDNGADKFIKRAQKWLDREFDIRKSQSKAFFDITSAEWFLVIDSNRIVEEVWFSSSSGKTKLEKKDLGWLQEEYTSGLSSIDTGLPTYYANVNLRTTADTDPLTIDRVNQVSVVASSAYSTDYQYTGIVFTPPSDRSGTIEVRGKFYQNELTNGSATSFWTEEEPLTLVQAALYQLESFYRNTEGMKDWLGAINSYLDGMVKDKIEEESYGVDQIEG